VKDGGLLALSPTLNKLWFAGRNGRATSWPADGSEPKEPLTLHVREINDKKDGIDLGVRFSTFDCLAPDGKTLVCAVRKPSAGGLAFENTLVDVASGAERKLDLPDSHQAFGIAPDGKWLLLLDNNLTRRGGSPPYRLYQFQLSGGEPRLLSGSLTTIFAGRISPDGKRVLTFARDAANKDNGLADITAHVIDVATAKAVRIAGHEKQLWSCGVWSPDSRRVAYAWRARADRAPVTMDGVPPTRLVVCDADGRNAATILTLEEFFWPVAWEESRPK
jgi:hypothetical protein